MLTKNVIIAITGRAGAGKDVAARLIMQEHFGFIRLAFADSLKQFVSNAMNLPISLFYDRIEKEQPTIKTTAVPLNKLEVDLAASLQDHLNTSQGWSPRDLCIAFGALARTIDPDVWADKVAQTIEGHLQDVEESSEPRGFLITDVRFPNELERLMQIPNTQVLILHISRKENETIDVEYGEKDIPDVWLQRFRNQGAIVDSIDNPGIFEEFSQRLTYKLRTRHALIG